MTANGTRPQRSGLSVHHLLVTIAFLLSGLTLTAQGTVQIVVPAVVSFQVVNIGATTVAGTNPSTISFDNAVLLPGQVLRISVKAESDLVPPSGPAILASNISWSTSNVSNGVGINGGLSKTVYTQVFQSQVAAISGGLHLNWNLSAPGPPLRAGTHQVVVRWKLEAVFP